MQGYPVSTLTLHAALGVMHFGAHWLWSKSNLSIEKSTIFQFLSEEGFLSSVASFLLDSDYIDKLYIAIVLHKV